MRPGMQCLLKALRGESLCSTIDDAEWEAALALAAEEHILPWVAFCLRSQMAPTPPTISSRLGQVERESAVAAFYWCSELKSLLQAFYRSKIRAIPLKGPWLAERLYGSAALRVSRDLDLLVSEADLSGAESALSAVGFVPGESDDYHRPWYRNTVTVELHHDVENPLAFDFHVEGALQKAQPATFQSQPCWKLAPEDELLFLCLHAARHRFERLSLLLDLQLAFQRLTLAGTEWLPRPEVAPLDCLIALGLAMARRLEPGIAPGIDVSAPDNHSQLLDDLAGRLWQQLLAQPSPPLDWRRAHAFFLEVEPPGWPRLRRRWRHLRILAGRVIEPDYTFAARFGLSRPWQVRLVRPFRLIAGTLNRGFL